LPIQKQDFYEGAALRRLSTSSGSFGLQFDSPFYVIDSRLALYIKYTTKARSPWGFTFSESELAGLVRRARITPVVLGFVCGSDGIAALELTSLLQLLTTRRAGFHISCRREHGKHYSVAGPAGAHERAIAPSNWQNLLSRENS
jgi:hypothetical protein